MAYLKNEDYIPACEIIAACLSRDLHLFTAQYKGIDNNFLNDFRQLIADAIEMESIFSITEEQKFLTAELYGECNMFVDKLLFMKSYAKETGLNFSIITTAVIQLRNRNVEGAVKNCRDAMMYYSDNAALLNAGDMPEGFLEDMIAKLNHIEALNNSHNAFLVSRKEKTLKNRAVYDRMYRYIMKICSAGKLIFKTNPVKREEYTIRKIASILKSSRRKKENTNDGVKS